MFEEDKYMNEFDRMVKSILDEGREEVPAGVWEAVSEGLDKAARGKTVVLWWRRAAAGVAVAERARVFPASMLALVLSIVIASVLSSPSPM